MKQNRIAIAITLLIVMGGIVWQQQKPQIPVTGATATISAKRTNTPPSTNTPTAMHTHTATVSPQATNTQGATGTPAGVTLPYPNASLCETHDPTKWHSLWDSVRGCHYDHEHGTTPFTQAVFDTFPVFDLRALLCNLEISHCVPSSPMEPTHKHGGHKWQVDITQNCTIGFEGATIGINADAMQVHDFGNPSVEFEARVHSSFIMARQCLPNSSDFGYVSATLWQDFGQRLFAYQGLNMPYPDAPNPSYPVGLGPYFSNQCIFCGAKQDTRAAVLAANANVATTWTSKGGQIVQQSLFNLLFRARDVYQVVDQRDQTYPFTYLWMCSNDGGLTFAPVAGCRYNNTTMRVHEIRIIIPAEWDNLAGFDTDPRNGRVTGEGYVTRLGVLDMGCTQAGFNCFPVKLVTAYVGHSGVTLQADKTQQFTGVGLPERDIYFCNGVLCSETSPGAIPSGWVGEFN